MARHSRVALKTMSVKKERERPYLRDPDDPEYIKDLQRPAVIKEDLSEMERRKRVQQLLESKSFCRELEDLIKQESESSKLDPDHLQTLQRLSDLAASPANTMSFASLYASASSAIPIADLKGQEQYTKLERLQRNKLASLFRLIDLFQWSQGINNTISQKIDDNSFLINPIGLLHHEITASSLVRVNETGEVVDGGSSKLGVSTNDLDVHLALHTASEDNKVVMHIHTAVVAAVASMKCGLLPLCQEAVLIGPVVSFENGEQINFDEITPKDVTAALQGKSVLFLRNRGVIVVGATVEQVALLAHNTVVACETQVRAARVGIENLVVPDRLTVEQAFKNSSLAVNGGSLKRHGASGLVVEWKAGELEWEAWMRCLDHAGFRTGHIYKQPLLRPKSALAHTTIVNNDVATPPTTSAMGCVDISDNEALRAHKLALMRKEQEKIRWLNSPNAYQKVEIYETGTDRPKKITKWIQDAGSSPITGTPVKINGVHQFSPASTNPKEFKEKQQQIKDNRLLGSTTAGPQSQVLDGVTFEQLNISPRPDNEGLVGQTNPEDRAILIGTASKGIIDRSHQHNAQVYKQIYAPNPFTIETDEGIKKYIEEVEAKSPRNYSARSTSSRSTKNFQRCPSPLGSFEADTASLMQGIREHQKQMANAKSVSQEELNTIDDSKKNDLTNTNTDTSFLARSSELESFDPILTSTPIRPDIKRGSKVSSTTMESSTTSARSTDETGDKKKKKGLFSFMRKKEKNTS